jgi:tagaturonate reductase
MNLAVLNKAIALNHSATNVSTPTEIMLSLPEKVLQFGTGVLLRGLPDYYINKANQLAVFNGRVVVVKSTGNGASDEFTTQEGLFTHCIKGYQNNQLIEETIINSSIARVLAAKTQWNEILQTAENKHMQLVISNTTEVGIVLDETDRIADNSPTSFPGKLLAWLHHRYKTFNGSVDAGVVIVPTELVIDNGTKLKLIVEQLAKVNQLDDAFIYWLLNANDFCNSLVDRIVPGKMPTEQHHATLTALGYQDDLMIMSEVYSLWAIETSNERSKEILAFSQVDKGVVIAPNINKFRELKLRLLNGTHTFSCGLAYLAGFETVKEAMANSTFSLYLHDLMTHEIAPCIESVEVTRLESYEFAKGVIDRFRNPSIDHRWLSITMNFTGKMQMRNLPLIIEHYNRFDHVPQYMAAGFAAYLLFMKVHQEKEGKYYGLHQQKEYHINDDAASYFNIVWQNNSMQQVVTTILSNTNLWGVNLTNFKGFELAVSSYLQKFSNEQLLETLNSIERNKEEVGV